MLIPFNKVPDKLPLSQMSAEECKLLLYFCEKCIKNKDLIHAGIVLHPGQWLASRNKIKQGTKLTDSKIRTAISNLKRHGYLITSTVQTESGPCTLYTIPGYENMGKDITTPPIQGQGEIITQQITSPQDDENVNISSGSGKLIVQFDQSYDHPNTKQSPEAITQNTDRTYTDRTYTDCSYSDRSILGDAYLDILTTLRYTRFNLEDFDNEGGYKQWIKRQLDSKQAGSIMTEIMNVCWQNRNSTVDDLINAFSSGTLCVPDEKTIRIMKNDEKWKSIRKGYEDELRRETNV